MRHAPSQRDPGGAGGPRPTHARAKDALAAPPPVVPRLSHRPGRPDDLTGDAVGTIPRPQNHTTAPLARTDAPSARRAGPAARRNAPSLRANAPFARKDDPCARTDGPSAWTNGPFARRG